MQCEHQLQFAWQAQSTSSEFDGDLMECHVRQSDRVQLKGHPRVFADPSGTLASVFLLNHPVEITRLRAVTALVQTTLRTFPFLHSPRRGIFLNRARRCEISDLKKKNVTCVA